MLSLKEPVWVPYTSKIEIVNKSEGLLQIDYNEGILDVDLKNTLCVLFYGNFPNIDQDILEIFTKFKVPIIYHSRNVLPATFIISGLKSSQIDVLTNQILFREDLRKRKYITRQILTAKFLGTKKLCPISIPKLSKEFSIDKLRNIEAVYSKLYWSNYFAGLNFPDFTRRGDTKIKQALDACSKFLSGIILRWINYHGLSPYHGFLHVQSSYPALVYDLIEPYRYIMDQAVCQAVKEVGISSNEKLTGVSITNLKDLLHEEVYCPCTRQVVRRQNMLHGVVLSLRAYLLGHGQRFIIPTEGEKKGGRPVKSNFYIPGKSAGYSKIYKQNIRTISEQNKLSTI